LIYIDLRIIRLSISPAGAIDPTPGNNTATDTDTVTPVADLAITKTDGHAAAVAGQPITYTIVASNAGPSTVFAATVTDTVPAGLVGATWTCTGMGGGTCTPGAAGDINDTANLPAGASVTYNLSGTVSGAATGNLSNTATVSTSGGVMDPNPGNNSATDVDPIVTLTADNNSPSSAKVLVMGSVSTDTLGPAPADENWFRYPVQAGRSYCVEVDNGNLVLKRSTVGRNLASALAVGCVVAHIALSLVLLGASTIVLYSMWIVVVSAVLPSNR
jgi:uncharacterized repeat protein (TIGR01451 family)